VVAANPQVVLAGEPPILIDEWQRVPATWDVIRRAVDDGAPPGSYLLAGSASEHGAHTGAGRILTLRMRPLTLSERGIGTPTVSVRQMLGGERPAIEGQTDVGLEDYAREIVGSGFPATLGLSAIAQSDFLDSYVQRIVAGGAAVATRRSAARCAVRVAGDALGPGLRSGDTRAGQPPEDTQRRP
jgi:predicted AAA+ superfamily ATPase